MPAYRTYINYIAARIIHFKGLSMQQFEIAFSGQILPGAQLEEVKAAIARMFQADATLLARLFSGQRVVIKKDLDAAGVAKYQGAFQRAGAVLEVLDISAPIIEEITPGLPVEEPVAPAPSAPTPTPSHHRQTALSRKCYRLRRAMSIWRPLVMCRHLILVSRRSVMIYSPRQ